MTLAEQLKRNKANQPYQFNPFDAEFKANPYPYYDYLRTHDPIHWGMLGGWVITRYADAKAILKDPRVDEAPMPDSFRKKSQYLAKKERDLEALILASQHWLFFLNPPDHTRMRGLVAKAFKRQSLQEMTPEIQVIANQLLLPFKEKGSLDIVTDFANLLPIKVIMKFLGLPEQDEHFVRGWVRDIFSIFDPLNSLQKCEAMNQISREFSAYLQHHINQRRKQPQSDLITALVEVEDGGEKLTDEEIISSCMMLAAAGEGTTASIIGNSILALLNHRVQLELLQQQPNLINKAVEELLRYDSPTQLVLRTAREPLEIAETTINKGDFIILCLGAANRDPQQFVDPDRLDLLRSDNQHIAFATGIHFCLGAALARVEVPIAIKTLVQQLPNLQLAINRVEYHDNVVTRFLKSLPVTFDVA
ncbi:MAG: cytochrome P450 [Crocosphaera sp.]|nr:cytochrome P450 [Crocosphaera sp.]